jgi:hypothetical protein
MEERLDFRGTYIIQCGINTIEWLLKTGSSPFDVLHAGGDLQCLLLYFAAIV